jgi:hypothetical protein
MLDYLRHKLGINWFSHAIAGREQHWDGSFHLHVFGSFRKAPDFKSARCFDIMENGKNYHPNIRKVGVSPTDRQFAAEYCMKDGNYVDFDLDLFKNSKDFRKKFADHTAWADHRSWRSKPEPLFPIPFPARLRIPPMTGQGKKRHYWIIGPPNSGKTTWLESTFKGVRVFSVPSKSTKPYDNYKGELVLTWDDHFPSWEEISGCSNYYTTPKDIHGDQRYCNKKWPAFQNRIMIVLSNIPPSYGQHMPAVEERFNFIELGPGQLLFDPRRDPNPYEVHPSP